MTLLPQSFSAAEHRGKPSYRAWLLSETPVHEATGYQEALVSKQMRGTEQLLHWVLNVILPKQV